MFKHCIDLEISTCDKDSLANARKLLESALTTYSKDVSLWREYYSLETKVGSCFTCMIMLASYAGFFRQLSKMDPKAEFAEIWIYVVVFLSGGEIVFERAPMCFKHFKNESSSEK